MKIVVSATALFCIFFVADAHCLPRLQTHPAEFKICETCLCMMLIKMEPYTSGPRINQTVPQTVFQCSRFFFGISSAIMGEMKEMDKVFCVFAGDWE